MCSRTVVLGRSFAVPSLTNRPLTALRSPILLCGFFAIALTSFSALVDEGFLRQIFEQRGKLTYAARRATVAWNGLTLVEASAKIWYKLPI